MMNHRKVEILVFNNNNDWYYTPYRRGDDWSNKMGWDPALFQFPCKCCGSPSHGLFHHKLDRLGLYEEARVSCPILAYDDVYEILSKILMSRKYEPAPKKLAEQCGHDSESVTTAIDLIRRRGAGRHMTEEQLLRLEQSTIIICQEVSGSWTFKREQILDSDDEELSDDC